MMKGNYNYCFIIVKFYQIKIFINESYVALLIVCSGVLIIVTCFVVVVVFTTKLLISKILKP